MERLATWWKGQVRADAEKRALHEKWAAERSSPETRLRKHVLPLVEAQQFLRNRINQLKEDDWETLVELSEVHELLGELPEALEAAERAEKVIPDVTKTAVTFDTVLNEQGDPVSVAHVCDDNEDGKLVEARVERLRRWVEAREATRHAEEVLRGEGIPAGKRRRASGEVPRRSASSLTVEEFHSEYASKARPVVITDLVDPVVRSGAPWTLDWLATVLKDRPAPMKMAVEGSYEWAGLEQAVHCQRLTVADYVASLDKMHGYYLFDTSIPLHFPDLIPHITIPSYFMNDFLLTTSPNALYHDAWPSLFVAPKGTKSKLHIDTFGSNFYMALFHGKKRWVFFSPHDLPFLYPHFPHSFDPSFAVDPLETVDLSRFPAYSLATPSEVVLEEGELLFVPAGCPHAVENLTDTLAISANFVDCSNYTRALSALQWNGLLDPPSAALSDELRSQRYVEADMDFTVRHTPLKEVKHLL